MAIGVGGSNRARKASMMNMQVMAGHGMKGSLMARSKTPVPNFIRTQENLDSKLSQIKNILTSDLQKLNESDRSNKIFRLVQSKDMI